AIERIHSFTGSHGWVWEKWCRDPKLERPLIPVSEHNDFKQCLKDMQQHLSAVTVLKCEGLLAHGIQHYKTKQGMSTLRNQLALIAGGSVAAESICRQLKAKAESLVA
ncbi:unnamed protein product, partial [Symbiodinium sp. CCMP2456]